MHDMMQGAHQVVEAPNLHYERSKQGDWIGLSYAPYTACLCGNAYLYVCARLAHSDLAGHMLCTDAFEQIVLDKPHSNVSVSLRPAVATCRRADGITRVVLLLCVRTGASVCLGRHVLACHLSAQEDGSTKS